MEVRTRALETLRLIDPVAKVAAVRALWAEWPAAPLDPERVLDADQGVPGRPERPVLVPPSQVPMRSPFTTEGRAALLHAIAHIEFNAINLALDAVARFAGMPAEFYADWTRVAAEEAEHFSALETHLHSLGHAYGDFPAHDGLWLMTWKTRHDFVARMALVPRTLEARGLDATPQIQDKLRRAGDDRAAEILDTVLREEVGHVAIGNRWYVWACEREGLHPQRHYAELLDRYQAPRPRPPLNVEARLQAGFEASELAWLQGDGLSSPS